LQGVQTERRGREGEGEGGEIEGGGGEGVQTKRVVEAGILCARVSTVELIKVYAYTYIDTCICTYT